MFLLTLPVGALSTNCYILACENTLEAAIIDPGDEPDRILNQINENKLTIKYIINTHGHWDHIGAVESIKNKVGAEILIHKEDNHMLQDEHKNLAGLLGITEPAPKADMLLKEEDTIEVGDSIKLNVLHTPGHTPGSMCLLSDNCIFTGDTVFTGSVGRTDLPGGSYETIVDSVRNKIKILPDELVVYPGHGPKTTIKAEKENNPFFK